MVKFVTKRLQVFVSSTFTDLLNERQAAVEAILTAGHIPAGMELFTSGDESQMAVIKQWIDESDIYLLILGGRYGSVEGKSRKSYTQLEYEYAVSQGKPLFSCVVTESALEANVKLHGTGAIETENPQKLKKFRAEVLARMVRFWEDAKDIKITVGETLSHFARREDLAGWVRADTAANIPALADEIARLSKENSELRARIADQTGTQIVGLSAEQMHTLLMEKGLLDLFVAIRLSLTDGHEPDDDSEHAPLTELQALGLVTYGNRKYNLSDEGIRYLNWYQATKRESEEA